MKNGDGTDSHPFGTFYTPAQTVDVETDAGFAGIFYADFVAFLLRNTRGGKSGSW